MDETPLVDHGDRRAGDPADRADLAGDAPPLEPAQTGRTEAGTRELYREEETRRREGTDDL